MTTLVAHKNKIEDLLKEFIANVKSDELKIEFNENFLWLGQMRKFCA